MCHFHDSFMVDRNSYLQLGTSNEDQDGLNPNTDLYILTSSHSRPSHHCAFYSAQQALISLLLLVLDLGRFPYSCLLARNWFQWMFLTQHGDYNTHYLKHSNASQMTSASSTIPHMWLADGDSLMCYIVRMSRMIA